MPSVVAPAAGGFTGTLPVFRYCKNAAVAARVFRSTLFPIEVGAAKAGLKLREDALKETLEKNPSLTREEVLKGMREMGF
jgi:hypothetical protein